MYRKYIQAVEPLDDFVLLIDFTSGSRLLLDMKPHLDSIRFGTPRSGRARKPTAFLFASALWSSAMTSL